jgi:hypothetical protein
MSWADFGASLAPTTAPSSLSGLILTSNTTLPPNITVGDLYIANGATVTIPANSFLRVTGTLIIDSGSTLTTATSGSGTTLQVNGAIYVNGTLTLAKSGDLLYAYPALVTIWNATLNVATGATAVVMSGMVVWAPSTITGGGTINLTANMPFACYVTSVGSTNTLGNITITGQGYVLWESSVTISGTVTVSAQAMGQANAFYGTRSDAATLTVNGFLYYSPPYSNTFLIGPATSGQSYNPTVTGTGVIWVMSPGTLQLMSNVTVTGSVSSSAMTIQGTGTLATSASTTLTLNTASSMWVILSMYGGGSFSWGTSTTLSVHSSSSAYICGAVSAGSTDVQLSYPTNVTPSGTGIIFFAVSNTGTGTNGASYSSASAAAGANYTGNMTATGLIPFYLLTSFTASVTGKYTLGIEDTTATTYVTFLLVYAGATSTFSLPPPLGVYTGTSAVDTSGHTIVGRNATGSAGTATISGTLWA